MTAEDIRRVTFSPSGKFMPGYQITEVDEFLERVAQAMSEEQAELRALREQVESFAALRDQVEELTRLLKRSLRKSSWENEE